MIPNIHQPMNLRHYALSEGLNQIATDVTSLILGVQLQNDRTPLLCLLEPDNSRNPGSRTIEMFQDGATISPGVNRRYIGATHSPSGLCHWFEVLE